jgi:hypothetical protein
MLLRGPTHTKMKNKDSLIAFMKGYLDKEYSMASQRR